MSRDDDRRVVDQALAIAAADLDNEEAALAQLEAQTVAKQSRVAGLRQTVQHLRQYAESLRPRGDEGPPLPLELDEVGHPNGYQPRPATHAEACLVLLGERPGEAMTLRQLADEIRKRGWIGSEVKNGVEIMRGTMHKLATKDSRVHKVSSNPIAYELLQEAR